MGHYILRRLFGSVITLFCIITLTFFMIRLAPGGPFDAERAFPPEVLKNIEARFDLDRPLPVQYGLYMKRILLEGDLGPSTRYAERSVNDLLAPAIGFSLILGGGALVTALLIGLFAGLMAALNHNKKLDYIPMMAAMVGISTPEFVLGNILVIIFALILGWFPVAGVADWQSYVLPCVTLGLVFASSVARLTRGGMLEVLGQDFIRTAKAKGLSRKRILVRHSLKGGLLPLVSFLGPATAGMMTGSIVVEKIFAIPGMGNLLIESAINRDYTLSLGCVIVFAILILFFNLVVDLLYGFLDPRVSYS